MAKKDMDLYHSRLTLDDLNDLIIKYKIPCDLHPRLFSEGFVMSELSNDAIEDLATGTPSSKILAKTKASQKRKAFTSSATLSHVSKRTRCTLAQLSGSTTRTSVFAGDDDESDDDACVKIPLVTPLHSTVVIPSSGNQGESSIALTTEGSNTRGIMVDDAAAASGGDAPYRPTFEVLMKEVFKDPAVCKTIVDQFPTPGEMVRVEGLSDDQSIAKISVLHCMMMSHDGEILALYHGLNQSHHEYMLSTYSRRKGYEEKLATFDASFSKSKAKGKERKKKIKSLSKSLDNLHYEVARLSVALIQATILKAESDEEIMRLKATPPKFSSFF
nr:hypothetical protein [Tanacetum cinerariifolium]